MVLGDRSISQERTSIFVTEITGNHFIPDLMRRTVVAIPQMTDPSVAMSQRGQQVASSFVTTIKEMAAAEFNLLSENKVKLKSLQRKANDRIMVHDIL